MLDRRLLAEIQHEKWLRERGARLQRETEEREREELWELARAQRLEVARAEIEDMISRERQLCQQDGSSVVFSLIGGLAANLEPDDIQDEIVVNGVAAMVHGCEWFYVGGTRSPNWR